MERRILAAKTNLKQSHWVSVMKKIWDLVIIGAGPAGMSAAIEASRLGLSALVLERQAQPGGQIFRGAGASSLQKVESLGPDYAKGRKLIGEFQASGAEFMPEATVWHILPGKVYVSHAGQSVEIQTKEVLIATGGMERPVPVPGWTLPGVTGAGAADVLLKSASLLPAGPVVLCGNGPLILQTALHLKHWQVPVAGVVLTGSPANTLLAARHAIGALARPAYLARGIAMGLRTAFGARCYPAAKINSIENSGTGLTLNFTSLGRKRSLNGNAVMLHEGVVSETRITRLARLRHIWCEKQRYWHAEADIWGQSNLEGMNVAGDCAGVRGADGAMALGRLAALNIARKLGHLTVMQRNRQGKSHLRVLSRVNAMQPFMDTVFKPSPQALLPADDAMVCRCEELTAGELRKYIMAGCYSPDSLKAQARPGMGACQGRMCAAGVSEMIAHCHGIPLEKLPPYHAQPPLFPLNIGELADIDMAPDAF